MRILTLALGVPFPPLGGGLTRTYHLLKSLASKHEVVLAAFTYGEPHEGPPFPLQIETVPWEWSEAYREMTGPDAAASRRAYERLTFEDDEPWFVSVLDPAAMEATLARIMGEPFDVVVLEGTPLARFVSVLPRDVPCVLDMFDVHSVMAARALDRASPVERVAAVREAQRTLAFERFATERCAACLTVSEEEATAVRRLFGTGAVHVVPNGVDTAYFVPSRERDLGTVVFTGRMNYEPNVDAACYFAEDVFPLVRRQLPHATFHVVGANPPPRLATLASNAVFVHGRVDDVRPFLASAAVVVVPVRAGGGTRLKVLEAAASGKAIVSTSLGVNGLAFRAGHDVRIADSSTAFADAVIALLRDYDLRATFGQRARAVALGYDWKTIGESFRLLLERIAHTK